jgi:hypothetical protein
VERTPLEACQSAGNLLLVESLRGSLALAPAVRSFGGSLTATPWGNTIIILLVWSGRMAVCHASEDAWLALRRLDALEGFHSSASRFRFGRWLAGRWVDECSSAGLLSLSSCSVPTARDVAGCTGGEALRMRFMSLSSGAMKMQRWLARRWRSACFALRCRNLAYHTFLSP